MGDVFDPKDVDRIFLSRINSQLEACLLEIFRQFKK